jgi:hypothetical protein
MSEPEAFGTPQQHPQPQPREESGVEPGDAAGEAGDADPPPLGVTVAPTGNAEVDALLERLADADVLPTDGHIEVYEDVHRGLRDALTALDSHPGPSAPVPAVPSTTYDDRR